MTQAKIIILGAGITGLTTALHLKKPFEVYEKEAEPGGLCRSRKKKGFTFDYSGHLLHFKDSTVRNWLKTVAQDNLSCYFRDSSIYSHSRLIPFPFQVNTHSLPPQIIKECVLGFIKATCNHASPKKNHHFKDWLQRTFGEGFTKHFFIPYNNKFWTVPVEDLSVDWIDGYIPVPTLEDVIEGAFGESKKVFGYNPQFWYPAKGGIEKIPLALAKKIKEKISLKHQAIKIDYKKKIILFNNGLKKRYQKLIITLPLIELKEMLLDLPLEIAEAFSKLRYTSILNLNLGIENVNLSEKHWIYFPEEKYSFYRIGFYNNFSTASAPMGASSLYVESSYNPQGNINKEESKETILHDLMGTASRFKHRIKDEDIIVKDWVDIKYAYIIYDKNYKKAISTIIQFLKEKEIYPAGRYGSWRYMSIEDSIVDGRRVADEINTAK
ncbi:protoporphyrinogen/coproporphyrinogen oxidase [Candidatus Auribacterota bacterium]